MNFVLQQSAESINFSHYMPIIDLNEAGQLENCLVLIASKRDKQAFSALFTWFAPKIQRTAMRQFNNETLAKDVVQETMTLIWRKAHLFNPEKGAASTWVYTIMRNVAFDMLRKVKNQLDGPSSEDIWPIMDTIAAPNKDEDHLSNKQLRSCINGLPTQQKEVIKAVYFDDLTQEQVAKKFNIPIGTVKSRLRLAMTKLQKQLGSTS